MKDMENRGIWYQNNKKLFGKIPEHRIVEQTELSSLGKVVLRKNEFWIYFKRIDEIPRCALFYWLIYGSVFRNDRAFGYYLSILFYKLQS